MNRSIEIASGHFASMLNHPFYVCLIIALLHSILVFVTNEPRPWSAFFSRLINLPFLVVILVFALCAVARNIRESYLYRLAHSYYHIHSAPTTYSLPVHTSGVTRATVAELDSSFDRDITSASPNTPTFSRQPFRR